ncbi:hypothetical protein ACGF07_34345 [Kitasatospora sp. NPDC048194]|uniref:hypothetical protein n=1 Tax=Kitasatospora sp. NPDC048194 TaxID=3364045 RepID=UPI0037117DEC
MIPPRRLRVFTAVLALLLVGYAATATAVWQSRSWHEDGPLAYTAPALPGTDAAETACRARPDDLDIAGEAATVKIVGGPVDGAPYLACYGQDGTGDVTGVVVLAAPQLTPVTDHQILKDGGAWHWVALVDSPAELVLAGLLVALLAVAFHRYHRRHRSARRGDTILALTGIGLLAIWALPGRTRSLKAHLALRTVLVWTAVAVAVLDLAVLDARDGVGLTVAGFLTATLLFGELGGRRLARFDATSRPA